MNGVEPTNAKFPNHQRRAYPPVSTSANNHKRQNQSRQLVMLVAAVVVLKFSVYDSYPIFEDVK